jgi:hypothetical protein
MGEQVIVKRVAAVVGLLMLAKTGAHAAAAPEITLPDVLAIELPKGANQIGPGDAPLRDLLNSAHDGSKKISFDLQRKVGVGPFKVTWSAWNGAVGEGKPAATRAERVFVFPFGMTPVGAYGGENGTGGNNATHIARDSTGRVHMVWQDGGRPGGPTGPVYRRATVAPDGAVRFETDPVYIADKGPSDWNARPALAVSGPNVQLVWQGGGTARTRRVSFVSNAWVMGPVIDTGAKSEGRDVGASVAIDDKGGIHIATPSGVYSYSSDEGKSWKNENFPVPDGESIKTQSITVDPAGMVHIAFSAPVAKDAPASGAGGYWQLRVIDRTPDGHWVNPTDVLANAPGWQELPKGSGDILADWARIAADRQGGLHVTWHGTTYTHKFANDSSFYAFKKAGGNWSTPVRLVPQASAIRFSYAPSVALDGDRALALTFFDVMAGSDSPGFDSRVVPLRNGSVAGPAIPSTQFVSAAIAAKHPETAMGSRFPSIGPTPWRTADGRTGVDILELMQSPFEPGGPSIVIYQRLDLTAALRR